VSIIPLGIEYTSTVEGSIVKTVVCERCQKKYGYKLTRRVTCKATSILMLENRAAAARATKNAEEGARKSLREQCDPVPCPQCGWYQKEMIPQARRELCAPVSGNGYMLLFIANGFLMGWLLAPKPWKPTVAIFAGVAGAIGVLVLCSYAYLLRTYDPNSKDEDAHKATGRARCIGDDELQKALRRGAPDEMITTAVIAGESVGANK
jgi:hypothetical protein